MTPIEQEIKLFYEGCVIEAEVNTMDDRKIRMVSASSGERYRIEYHRNEHHMFVVYDVTKC